MIRPSIMCSTEHLRQCRRGQWLRTITLLLYVIQTFATLNAQDAILNHYKPIAMDEAVYIISKDDPYPWKNTDNGSKMSEPLHASHRINLDKDISDTPPASTPIFNQKTRSGTSMERGPDSVTETLLRSSTEGTEKGLLDLKSIGLTPKLTKLITQQESNKPTFLQPAPVKPFAINNDPGSKILASYNVVVPILIPPIKKRKPIPAPPPKFVKEVVTEMVPVKSVVPQFKEVYKAEMVPQEIVTDYVNKNENSGGPTGVVDDKVRGRERILQETVEMT